MFSHQAIASSIIAGVIIMASSAVAQITNPPSVSSSATPLTCADFQHNPDGSWSPLHPVTINGVTMGGPGVKFTVGVAFGGVDLAAALNNQCR
jgi:hypothetical protein